MLIVITIHCAHDCNQAIYRRVFS